MEGSEHRSARHFALLTCLVLGSALFSPAVSIAANEEVPDPIPADEPQTALQALGDELNAMIGDAIELRQRIEPATVEAVLSRYLERSPASGNLGSSAGADSHTYLEMVRFATLLAPDLDIDLPRLAEQAAAAETEAEFPSGDPLESALLYLVNRRDFEGARAFGEKHGMDVPGWIASVSPQGRAPADAAHVYRFSRSEGDIAASLVPVDVATGAWMVVEVHPHCGFSQRAMQFLSESGALSNTFPPERVVWVVSQDRSDVVPAMVEWNEAHPELEMTLAHRNSHWPDQITFLQYPVFNFLRDGELVDQVVGWTGDEQIDSVWAGMERLNGDASPPAK